MQDLNLRLNWIYPNQSFFDHNSLKVVGDAGFEPATPCTPCRCATGLRHIPNGELSKFIENVLLVPSPFQIFFKFKRIGFVIKLS